MSCSQIKITAIKAVQFANRTQCLVKIETDAGLVGYGEAGGPGPMVRGNIRYLEPALLGQDPVDIEVLYQRMVGFQHPNRPHMPTVSGIDIALWDLAGQILGRSISELVRGRFRDEIPLYVNAGAPEHWQDPEACRAWADQLQQESPGIKAVKMGFRSALPRGRFQSGRRAVMLRVSEIQTIARMYQACREALPADMDLIIHCHNEFDLAGATGLARALAPVAPLWIEDALPVPYSDSWRSLKQASPVPILTGEKLELPLEFLPFITNGAVDMLQPDIAFAGGFTGCWKTADLAEMYYIPVTAHNVGSVVQNVATAHFGASTPNFAMSETRLTRGHIHLDLIEEQLVIRDGMLQVPDGPGLGIHVNEGVLKTLLASDEPWWD